MAVDCWSGFKVQIVTAVGIDDRAIGLTHCNGLNDLIARYRGAQNFSALRTVWRFHLQCDVHGQCFGDDLALNQPGILFAGEQANEFARQK